MRRPKVSVIIPSYNHEKYVDKAIDSVLAQTFTNFELLIIDDASQDKSVEVICHYTDPRIRLFVHEKNAGAVATLNEGISKSRGEYIAILNSDDLFLPTKLAKQVAYLDKTSSVGAVFTHVSVIQNKKSATAGYYATVFMQPNRTSTEWLSFFFKYGNALCHPSILIRRECYKKIGLYDARYHQLPDFDMWVRFAMKYSLYIIQEPLTQFRVLAGRKNTSAKTNQTQIRSEWELRKILDHYLTLSSSQLLSIFPELSQQKINSYSSHPYYQLVSIASQLEKPSTLLFALDTLHCLLGLTSFRKKQTKVTLHHLELELIALSGKLDVFGLKKHSFYQHELYGVKNEVAQYSRIIQSYKKSYFFTLWRAVDKLKQIVLQ